MSVRINFRLTDDARRGLDAVEVEMTRIGLEIEKHAAAYLDAEKINVDGDLKKSLYHEVERFQNLIRLKSGAGVRHAPYVHFGTKPHWPPRAPLVRWAKKKFGLDDKDAKRVGFLVARKISKKGTEARPFMDKALEKIAGTFAQRVGAAYLRGFGT
jgi:hypothetical protein